MGLGTVLTRCCLALSLAGWLYWLSFDCSRTVKIIMIAMAVALIIIQRIPQRMHYIMVAKL